jgi:nicotinate phosphoribosyltransferase
VFHADLGIALTDTYGLDAFLGNFDLYLAKLYDGVRHDSGDPIIFTNKVVAHYRTLKIDPISKVALFSDNLKPNDVLKINEYCKGHIKASFGIGTNFTNDFPGSPALNMVIKLNSINDIPVVKLSDSKGKACGDPEAIRVAEWMFHGKPLVSEDVINFIKSNYEHSNGLPL